LKIFENIDNIMVHYDNAVINAVPSGDTVSNSGIYVQMTIEFKNMTGTTTPMIIAEFVDLSV
jgi:hypothetical protein